MTTAKKPEMPRGQGTEDQSNAESQCCSGEPNMKSPCQCFQEYARRRPEVVAMWCFGLGLIVGWKLKSR